MTYRLTLLGGVSLEGTAGPLSGRVVQRRQLALLSLLGSSRGRPVTRDKAVGLLWGDKPEAKARRFLSDALYVIRGALGAEAVIESPEGLRLNEAVVWCDAAAFEEAADEERWHEAVELYGGPFMDGFYVGWAGEFERWMEGERSRLASRHQEALERLAEAAEAEGDWSGAAARWKERAGQEPTNSRVILRLMRAQAAAGNVSGALEQARVHELLLREEFDLPVPDEVRALARELTEEGGTVEEATVEPPASLVEPSAPSVEPAAPAGGGGRGAAAGPSETAVAQEAKAGAHPLRRSRIIGGGIAASLLLGVLVGGYFATGSLGVVGSLPSAGDLEEGDWVVVADFDGTSDDPGIGTTVSDLLRIDLAEHPTLRVADRTELLSTLQRMQANPDTVLTAELAREVAVREGMAAVLEGEVSELGTGYVVSAVLRSAESGESLVSMREAATDEDGLIPAAERLSERARERAGESLPSIRAGPELAQLTTSSLDALRLFSEGERTAHRSDRELAIELLEEAVERDPEFAMAWRRLAVHLLNAGVDRPRMREAFERAYELRDRLTDLERYKVEAIYHSAIERDREAAARMYRRILEIDPYDRHALHNLSVTVGLRHDYDRSIELQERLQEKPNPWALSFARLISYHLAVGEIEEARAVLERFIDHHPQSPVLPIHRSWVRFHEGNEAGARAVLEQALEDPSLPSLERSVVQRNLGRLHLWRGRLAEAREHFDASERTAAELDDGLRWMRWTEALLSEAMAGDSDRAARSLLEEQDNPWVGALPSEDGKYGLRIMVLSIADRPAEAESLLREWEAEAPPEAWNSVDEISMAVGSALVLLQEGRAGEAVERMEAFRSAARCPRCHSWLMGWALREAGQLEDAAREWEYAASSAEPPVTPGETTAGWRHIEWHLWTIRKLAPLYEELGETERAVHYYRRLGQLWEDADPELQPQVEHARDRVAALERGWD